MMITHWVNITPEKVCLDGVIMEFSETGADLLTAIYRKQINDYPKFFKMDMLSKLGFVASELLLGKESERFISREDRAIVFFNRSSSICDDKNYQATIQDKDNYYPSPSVFVYTLPNIVTGEIAIRNKYLGETSFYVLNELDTSLMKNVVEDAFQDDVTSSALCGWLDCMDKDHFESHLFVVEKEGNFSQLLWDEKTINELIYKEND